MYRFTLTDANSQPVPYPFAPEMETDTFARRPVVVQHAAPISPRVRRDILAEYERCFPEREVVILPGATRRVRVSREMAPGYVAITVYDIRPLVGEEIELRGQGEWEMQPYAAEVVWINPFLEPWQVAQRETIPLVRLREWVPGDPKTEENVSHARAMITAALGTSCFIAVGANLCFAEALPIARTKPQRTDTRPARNRKREVGRRA